MLRNLLLSALILYIAGFFLLSPVKFSNHAGLSDMATSAEHTLYAPLLNKMSGSWLTQLWYSNKLYWCRQAPNCNVQEQQLGVYALPR